MGLYRIAECFDDEGFHQMHTYIYIYIYIYITYTYTYTTVKCASNDIYSVSLALLDQLAVSS